MCKSRRARISFVMSNRPSACISSSLFCLIFVISRKSVEKIEIWLKSDNNIGQFTCRPKYAYIDDSSTKYLVSRQQCKGNPLFRFHGNIKQLYVVDSDMWFTSTKAMYCYVSMTTVVAQTRHNVAFIRTLPVLFVVLPSPLSHMLRICYRPVIRLCMLWSSLQEPRKNKHEFD